MRDKLAWLQISDIHFNPKTEWRDSPIRITLLSFLKGIFENDPSLRPDFIFCTGDIAFGESTSSPISKQYDQAKIFFDELLNICGNPPLPKERLFVVPGNHDVNRGSINDDAQKMLISMANKAADNVDKINQRFNDQPREFKDSIKRLDEYAAFIADYLPHLQDKSGRHQYASIIDIDELKVGVAGFNSAWSCAGSEDDRNIWLAASWQFSEAHKVINNSDIRIGLIHHPTDWLNVVDRDVATKRISKDFDFWLHGHIHNSWIAPLQSHIVVAAGAIGASSNNEFGVNLISLDLRTSKGLAHLYNAKSEFNDWAIAPIPGQAPLGKWEFSLPRNLKVNRNKLPAVQINTSTESVVDRVGHILTQRLEQALRSFSDQSAVWILPTLSKEPEIVKAPKEELRINLPDFIASPKSTIIKAPAQYGLTCLAHHFIKEAWNTKKSQLWIYLDAKLLKPNKTSIEDAIANELASLECNAQDIKCLILDSCRGDEKDDIKLLTKLSDLFSELPIICMQQMDLTLSNPNELSTFGRQFEVIYLWALPRNKVRRIVAAYNESSYIGDEDSVTTRVISDLEMFNLHRTVLNCLTLLKAYEANFVESPINRSEMINRVLFQLFNSHNIPTYKTRPDLQDCEYVLGYICEMLIRDDKYYFSRDKFLLDLNNVCKLQLMDLETHVVFDVLYENNIIVKQGSMFCFKFAFWIYYFAAHRMHHSPSFVEFIFENMRYAKYPELIEFYTGIDRKRDDALKIITKDLHEISTKVKESCGFPDEFNPYRYAKWTPSPDAHEKMEKEIMQGVLESNLPDEIKDKFADRTYDQARPFNQSVGSLLNEPSFWCMLQTMRAGAKALRNSDYSSTDTKRQLLNEILYSWEQATRVLFVVLPVLANEGSAMFEGTGIYLAGDFGATPQDKFMRILSVIPTNVISWCQDDLFSQKMGPLLIEHVSSPKISSIGMHELILLLIRQRPRGWEKKVHSYIVTLAKDSFYLLDVFLSLRLEYSYSYASSQALEDMKHLIMMTATKHITGIKDPSEKAIGKVKFVSDPIPSREVE
jgi:predicted MPP superfamily phosphohydrolase